MRPFDCRAKGIERIAVAIDRMPHGNEGARLGEQQKHNAIHDRQRLLERVVQMFGLRRFPQGGAGEGCQNVGRGRQDTALERAANAVRVAIGGVDQILERVGLQHRP